MSEGGITRKQAVLIGGAGLVAGSAAVAGVALKLRPGKPAVVSSELTARFRDGELPGDDPGSDGWRHADPIIVPLQPQQIAQPFLQEGTIRELVARALHNGKELGLLLEWDDADRDDLDGIGVFHDGVAVQLPARAGTTPPITMGGPGAPVHVLQWRATWQRDLAGKTGVDQIYPRVVHDIMPDDILSAADALPYWPGRAVGNPVSNTARKTAVEEIVAEGFGTVTHVAKQSARGGAIHEGGRWKVAMAMALERPEAGDPLRPDTQWPIAFAVWEGADGNRGGRKHIAGWLTLGLEATA